MIDSREGHHPHPHEQACARYIAAQVCGSTSQINGLSFTERWKGLGEYVRRHPGPCPLPTPVDGRIEGEPWTTAIDHTETRALMRHLGTACFIVIAYLSSFLNLGLDR
ncbi:hypothetical protein AB0D57_37700 [Streptomyces sp. NPDC048275]|uniref:hypothetical protein n=1 Tax=Streptomyces sp. NPDC048275 TaxID=3155629 RepID=UPI0033EF6CFC